MSIEPRAILNALVITVVIAFVLYRRVRRSIGRQRLQPGQLWFRIALFSVVCVLILFLRPTDVTSWAFAAGGALLGGVLAFYAYRHTRFEFVPEGRFYTPNVYIGLGVTALLIGRIGYRFMEMAPVLSAVAAHTAPNTLPTGGNGFTQAFGSPTTVGLYFVMAGYYICYYAGLITRLRGEP